MFVFFEKILLQIPNLHEKLRIKFSKSVTRFFSPPPSIGLRPKGVSRPYPLLARFPLGLRTNIDVKVFDGERSERVIVERSEA